MFDSLLSFWKGKDFLTQVLGDFKIMLEDTGSMFEAVCGRLLHDSEEPDLKERIYAIDKKVNSLQKEIRKRVIEHLSLQPTVEVPACLLLMSVVKDAERLGDYAKNLYEVTEILEKPIDKALFNQYFDDVAGGILKLFEQTMTAFMNADEEQARKGWEYERAIAKRCDRIVEELAKSSLSVNEAVCFVLIARHFKRIVAHLVNIGTSVVLPLSDLDYFDEQRSRD